MSKLLKSYYIGEPGKPRKRGQDKSGSVYCLLWLMIYPKGEFFAKSNEYTLGNGGGGIGRVKSIEEGRKILHKYVINSLNMKKNQALDELKRIENSLIKLGDDSANLEQFLGEYEVKK